MTTKPFEFEPALKELEDITLWFESSDVDLDAGLVKFERGMELTSQLKAHLSGVENRIEKIKQKFSAASATGTAPAAEPTTTSSNQDDDQPPRADADAPQNGLFGA
jgi:exodeoxyribonuclease VII small subunit